MRDIKKKKILILNDSIDPVLHQAETARTSMIAQALANNGFEIKMIYFNKIDANWLRDIELIKMEKEEPTFLQRKFRINGVFSLLTGFSLVEWKLIKQLKKIIKKEKNIDLILTLGLNDRSINLINYPLLNINNIPWLVYIPDPYPITKAPVEYRHKLSFFKAFHRERIAKKIYRKATYVAFPSLKLARYINNFYNGIYDKSLILPHVYTEIGEITYPQEPNIEIAIPKNKFNILHVGRLYSARKIDSFLEALELFFNDSKKKETTCVSFVGKIDKSILPVIKQFNYIENIKFYPYYIGYNKSIELIKQADVSVVIEAPVKNSPFMPGKLADLLYFKKPVLALSCIDSETIRILGEDYPFQASPNNKIKILEQLNKLWELWKKNRLKLPKENTLKQYISDKYLVNKISEII